MGFQQSPIKSKQPWLLGFRPNRMLEKGTGELEVCIALFPATLCYTHKSVKFQTWRQRFFQDACQVHQRNRPKLYQWLMVPRPPGTGSAIWRKPLRLVILNHRIRWTWWTMTWKKSLFSCCWNSNNKRLSKSIHVCMPTYEIIRVWSKPKPVCIYIYHISISMFIFIHPRMHHMYINTIHLISCSFLVSSFLQIDFGWIHHSFWCLYYRGWFSPQPFPMWAIQIPTKNHPIYILSSQISSKYWLVVSTPLKNLKSIMTIPNVWKNKNHVPVTTNQNIHFP